MLLLTRPIRLGRSKIPCNGPVIVAANHRSFIDPFVIALLSRRKMYFVAKAELFHNRLLGWLLGAVGVFPVRRGAADRQMLMTSLELLRRGDCLMMFPEGTRTREARLGRPLRGFGKLAVRSGAAVVPVAVAGTGVSERRELGVHRVVVSAADPECGNKSEADGRRPDDALLERVWGKVEHQWAVACRIAAE